MTDPLPTSLPPWREPLSRALHRNRSQPFARYFQLATVRPDGRPANRTVVFRGFVDPALALQSSPAQHHGLKLVTDQRSEKMVQLGHCAWAEACWYFTKTREQFRLAGQLHPVDPTTPLHRQSWQALSAGAQQQFGWPDPGAPRPPQETDAGAFEGVLDPDNPPKTFVVLLLTPDWVDHLELRGNPQQRSQYQRYPDSDRWTVQAVNP